MLRVRALSRLVVGCTAFGLAGCVVPGGGTYYQPAIPGGKVRNNNAIIAGHKNIASRKFDELNIETRAREKGKFLHVTISFDIKKPHEMGGDFGLARVDKKQDGKEAPLPDVSPMAHMVSPEMDVGKDEITAGSHPSYTLYFDIPQPAPKDFVVVIPDLRLDGRQLGPLRIAYRRKSGVWLYLISM